MISPSLPFRSNDFLTLAQGHFIAVLISEFLHPIDHIRTANISFSVNVFPATVLIFA